MSPTEVLITFYCRTGDTELLALAAAVGAVQARANIRLRRLPDSIPVTPDSNNALTRMCKEYVPPTEADVLRAIQDIDTRSVGTIEVKQYGSNVPRYVPFAIMASALWAAGISLKLAVPWFSTFP